MAKLSDWRKMVNLRDLGDVVALLTDLRKIAGRTGQKTARRIEHDVRESHVLDDVTRFADRLGTLVARKGRELERTRQQATQQIKQAQQDLRQSPIVEQAEATAEKLRDTVDQKTYEAAKQVVERHESRHRQDEGEAGLFVVGAILGTLVGAAAAIWFAPQSGQATRRDIEQTAEEARKRIEGESVADAIRDGKAEARRFQESMTQR